MSESNLREDTPKVYLISRPQLDFDALDDFLEDRNLAWLRTQGAKDSEEIVEVCGRICYLSFSDDPNKIRHPVSKYVANLISQGHDSVLEHATWTFIIDRVSRSFTHQLVRHRVGFSYSQLSQQYHDESNADFVVPAGLREHRELFQVWLTAIEKSQEAYREILAKLSHLKDSKDSEARRWIRSVARSLLPNSTESAIAVTCNARSLRHFFELRGAIRGDYEMRMVSAALYEIVSKEAPSLFADFVCSFAADGYPELHKAEKSGVNLDAKRGFGG